MGFALLPLKMNSTGSSAPAPVAPAVPPPTAPVAHSNAALVATANAQPAAPASGSTSSLSTFLQKKVVGNVNVGEVGIGLGALGVISKLMGMW